jgi:hypothetical protein
VSAKTLAKVVAAVIAAAASLTSIAAFVQGQLDDPGPPAIRTQILRAELAGRHERYGDYLTVNHLSTKGLTRRQLDEEGLVFNVVVRLRGAVGAKRVLRKSMYEEDGPRLRGRRYNAVAAEFEPTAPKHEGGGLIWSAYPPRPGSYYMLFTLYDTAGHQEADRRTRPFRIAEVPDV